MIIGFFGDPRAGKTLSAVAEIREMLMREPFRKVYSNIVLNFPYEPITLKMVMDATNGKNVFAEDSIVFVDEIYLWLDSRASASTISKVLTWFLMQTGKMGRNTDIGMVFLYTSQYPDLIDVRLWKVSASVVFCDKIHFEGHKFISQRIFIRKIRGLDVSERVIPAEEFYKLYDTRERVVSIQKEET